MIILDLLEELKEERELNDLLRTELHEMRLQVDIVQKEKEEVIEQKTALKERLIQEARIRAGIRTTKYDSWSWCNLLRTLKTHNIYNIATLLLKN